MVTIIFLICANVNRVLTVLAIICLTLACALVDDLKAITEPFAHRLMTCGVVHARIADALVHVDIAVATERWIIWVVITFQHGTL
jgi:hypothetical protein